MNGYSDLCRAMSDMHLAKEIADIAPRGKYSNPAQDIHWYYVALLEEQKNRNRRKAK